MTDLASQPAAGQMAATSGTSNREESLLNQNGPAPKEFRLELFGGPTLYRGDSVVRLSPQESLLIGLLGAFGREGVLRDDLLDLFWSTGTRKTLRLRLSQLLHIVRRKSGSSGLIVQNGRKLQLNEELANTDLTLLSAALKCDDHAGALRIFRRGPFCWVPGPETHALEDLIGRLRGETLSQLGTALSRAVQQAEAAADYPRLAALASLQMQLEPSDESALRCLLQALGAQGRVGQAKAEYRRFCGVQSRLAPAWSPSADTQALLASLGRVSSEAPWLKRYLRHVGNLAPPVLGRDGQRAVLQGILQARENLKPRLITITSAPGIGRSRILHETLRDLELAGAAVLFGRCGGRTQNQSFHPVSEALASRLVDEALTKMKGVAPQIIRDKLLARFSGDFRRPLEASPHPVSLYSLCESLVELFSALSPTGAVVFALDDAHLADPDTLDLLSYMMRRDLPPQVTIMLAVDDKAPQAAKVLGMGEPFTHLVDSYILPLAPLQKDSLEHLVVHILGQGYSGNLISAIAALSGGSPKKATQLCELISASLSSSPDSEEEVFARVMAQFCTSLPRLPRRVLSLLAVADASIPVHCIAEILGAPEDDIRRSVNELSLCLIRSTPSELCLSHPYLGAALYRPIPPRDKRPLHIALAGSLEALDDFSRSNQIATHLLRGSEHSRAVQWVERALLGAVESFDPSPSVALAEELLESAPSPETRIQLNALLGRHWLRLGEAAKSTHHFERALSVGRTFRVGAELIRTVEVSQLEALALKREHAVEVIVPEIRRLKEQLTQDSQWDLLARVLHVAFRFVDSGRLPELEDELLEHISSVLGPDPGLLLEDHLPLALVFSSQLRKGQNPRGEEVLAKALENLRRSGDELGVAKALQISFLGRYHSASLNTPEGILERRDSLRVVEGLQDRKLFCRHHLNTAVWYLDTFDLEGAAKAISHAEEYASNLGPQLSREMIFNRAELLYFEGRSHEALHLFLDGYQSSPTFDPDAGAILFAAGASCCYARMRRAAEARTLLPPAAHLNSPWSVDLSLLLRAHGQLSVGKAARVELLEQCDQLLAQLRDTSVTWHLKALYQVCDIRHRFGLPAPREDVLLALQLCSDRRLPYVAARLRPYVRSL